MIRTIPKYSWTRKFDEKEPDSSVHSPGIPPWYDILKLLPIAYRISNHISHEKRNKREPIFDLNGLALRPPHPGPHAGAPLGGIGCGCIGRGFKGEFRRWSLHPGKYVHKAIVADLFAIRVNRKGKIESVVLSLMKPDEYSCLNNWNWNMSAKCGTYYAVYPRAWTVYEDPLPNIRVIIKQISPFLPDNYSDSSLPTAVFEVEVENKSVNEEIDVSVMFCFQNGLDSDCSMDRYLKNFQNVAFTTDSMHTTEVPNAIDPVSDSSFSVTGVAMHHETARIHLTTVREREEVIQSDADVIYNTSSNNSSRVSDDVSNNLCSVLISEAERVVERKFTDKISIAIAGKKDSTNTITTCSQFITRPQVSASSYFDCRSEAGKGSNMQDYDNESTTAEELWLEFHNTGNIFDRNYAFPQDNTSSDSSRPLSERRYGSAVCIRRTIPRASSASSRASAESSKPLNCGVFSFSLAWDYPLARFGGGKALPRYYTKFFGDDGYNAADLAAYALWKAADWESDIINWQEGVFNTIQSELQQSLHSSSDSFPTPTFFPLPNQSEYYYYQLFNELYYLVDGGTQWLDSAGGRSNQSSLGSMMMIDETREIREEELSINVNKQSHERDDQHIVIEKNNKTNSSLNTKLITSEQPRNISSDRNRNSTQSIGRKRALARNISWEHIVSIAVNMIKHNEKARHCAGNQSIIGQFLYLEGHEYLMYNTYDVHFYASFALIMLWPQLELSLQKDFAYAVLQEDLTQRQMMGEGDYCIRKKKGAVPHDVGAPCEEPWEFCNAYNFQDVSRWKDLGSKFILQIYRNYYYLTQILPNTTTQRTPTSSEGTDTTHSHIPTGHRKHEQLLLQYMKELYPILLTVMQSMEKQFDTDNDGMIENSGFPDQTYDIWIAEGIHAYCGGLWISACEAIGRIAALVDDSDHQEYYHNLAEKGRQVYLKELWNGIYLNYDNSQSSHHDSIMADMLAGQWYARACQLPPPISAGHAFSCLKTIYENNVIAFGKGQLLGAVNGMRPDKEEADQSCLQSREVWTGTTYGVAATMLQEAFHFPVEGVDEGSLVGAIGSTILSIEQRKELVEMAYTTAKGIHDAGWQRLGYWFATPEAWGSTGNYRSLSYMRPLSIWSMQYARVQSEAIFSKLRQSQEEEE